MVKKAVQQIMLGKVTADEKSALKTLKEIKKAGYDGIELNGFMIRPTSLMVRLLTRVAGMPTGKGGGLDWKSLVKEAGLLVVSIHEDLGMIENNTDQVIREALEFGTDKVVITGMYRFDYTDEYEVRKLCQRLNLAGQKLKENGIQLLYHNHNVEFSKLKDRKIDIKTDFMETNAYGLIIKETDPDYVNFEMDSYWIADAGVDPLYVMKKLENRLKLYHINDRGNRQKGTSMTPIIRQDSMELGYGNMNLKPLVYQALSVNVSSIILESHRNFVDKSPVKSLQLSSDYLNQLI